MTLSSVLHSTKSYTGDSHGHLHHLLMTYRITACHSLLLVSLLLSPLVTDQSTGGWQELTHHAQRPPVLCALLRTDWALIKAIGLHFNIWCFRRTYVSVICWENCCRVFHTYGIPSLLLSACLNLCTPVANNKLQVSFGLPWAWEGLMGSSWVMLLWAVLPEAHICSSLRHICWRNLTFVILIKSGKPRSCLPNPVGSGKF